MPLIVFEPGQQARSADLNDNFSYIEAHLGLDSSPDEYIPGGSIRLGPRKNFTITAQSDTRKAPNSSDAYDAFALLRCNGRWEQPAGAQDTPGKSSFRYGRYTDGEPITMVQIGWDGIHFKTSRMDKGGDPNGYVTDSMWITQWGNIVIPASTQLVHKRSDPETTQDYRLTYVPLNEPITMHNDVYLSGSMVVRKATDYRGIPADAKAIQINSYIYNGSGTAVAIKWHTEKERRNQNNGLINYAAPYVRGAALGIVVLGQGAYGGKFVEERVGGISQVLAWIIGYYI